MVLLRWHRQVCQRAPHTPFLLRRSSLVCCTDAADVVARATGSTTVMDTDADWPDAFEPSIKANAFESNSQCYSCALCKDRILALVFADCIGRDAHYGCALRSIAATVDMFKNVTCGGWARSAAPGNCCLPILASLGSSRQQAWCIWVFSFS